MNIMEIIKQWLSENSFDGLYSEDGSCACKKDDLIPCGKPGTDCTAGYETPCPGPDDCELSGDCDFHISPNKAVKPNTTSQSC